MPVCMVRNWLAHLWKVDACAGAGWSLAGSSEILPGPSFAGKVRGPGVDACARFALRGGIEPPSAVLETAVLPLHQLNLPEPPVAGLAKGPLGRGKGRIRTCTTWPAGRVDLAVCRTLPFAVCLSAMAVPVTQGCEIRPPWGGEWRIWSYRSASLWVNSSRRLAVTACSASATVANMPT